MSTTGSLGKIFKVVEIFVTASRLLVGLEMRQTDQVDIDLIQDIDDACRISLRETDTGNGRRNVDSDRWHTHADHLAFSQEESR